MAATPNDLGEYTRRGEPSRQLLGPAFNFDFGEYTRRGEAATTLLPSALSKVVTTLATTWSVVAATITQSPMTISTTWGIGGKVNSTYPTAWVTRSVVVAAFPTVWVLGSGVKLSSLQDTFSGSTVDGVKWPVTIGSPTVANGKLVLNTSLNSYIQSATIYDFTGSGVSIQLTPGDTGYQFLEVGGAWATFPIEFGINASPYRLNAYKDNAPVVGSSAYDPVAMAYLRIREASGVIYFEYSADSITWTLYASAPHTYTGINSSWVYITSYSGTGTTYVDNVNIVKVQGTYSTTWALKGGVAQTQATSWLVRTSLAQTQATSWLVRSLVSSNYSTSWSIRSTITSSKATSWLVRTSLAQTKSTSWYVLTSLAQTKATSWLVLTSTAKTQVTSWSVLASLSQTKSTSWYVLTSLAQTKATSWIVRSLVQTSIGTVWLIRVRLNARVKRNDGAYASLRDYVGTDIKMKTAAGWTSLKTPTTTDVRIKQTDGTWISVLYP